MGMEPLEQEETRLMPQTAPWCKLGQPESPDGDLCLDRTVGWTLSSESPARRESSSRRAAHLVGADD